MAYRIALLGLTILLAAAGIVYSVLLLPPDSARDVADRAIVVGELGAKLDRRLTPFIDRVLADHDAVGLAVGVTHGDEIVYARGFGPEIGIGTVFHMASVTKPFTATAIVKLAEQGKLDLDDRVVDHLPYFMLDGPDFDGITLRHVLTHTSGIPRNTPESDWAPETAGPDALERFVRRIRDLRPEFPPGTRYAYSNVGFCVLGDVIAKASGATFEEYMQREILVPSGMHGSTFFAPEPLPSHWARPYVLVLTTEPVEEYPYNREYAPAATLHSSVLDMSRWAIVNLNRGRGVLAPASHDRMWTPQADTPWGEKIGLSWYLQSYAGRRTVLHTGEDPGFSTQMILYPDEDVSIVVMANRDYSRTARIANAAAEALFDLEIKGYEISGRIPFGRTMEEEGFEAAVARWREIAEDERYFTNEWELNVVGHSLIRAGRFAEAKQVFGLNIEEYPASPNTYDSYGDALRAEGDVAGALVYFRKALEVDPAFEEPRPKIAEIEAELRRDPDSAPVEEEDL